MFCYYYAQSSLAEKSAYYAGFKGKNLLYQALLLLEKDDINKTIDYFKKERKVDIGKAITFTALKLILSENNDGFSTIKYKKGKDDTFEYENFDKVKILSSLLSLNIEDDSENSSQTQFLNAFLSSIKQNENE